jgi:hypothetical protein
MLDHYIQRGHNIKELLALDEYEKLFFIASMEKAIAENKELSERLKNIT